MRKALFAVRWLIGLALFGVGSLFMLYGALMWIIDDTADCSHEDRHDCQMIQQGRVIGPVGGLFAVGLGSVVLWAPNLRRLWYLPEEGSPDQEGEMVERPRHEQKRSPLTDNPVERRFLTAQCDRASGTASSGAA